MKLFVSLFLVGLFLACNSSQEKSKDAENELINSSKDKGNTSTNDASVTDIEHTKLDLGESERISFKTESWYRHSFVFNGLNTALLSALVANYVKDKHLDPNREYSSFKDSVAIDLEKKKFTFYRRTPSEMTEYDVEYQIIASHSRIPSEEDPSVSEDDIKRMEKELEESLNEIDPKLKKVKAYDVHIVRAGFIIKNVENEMLKLELTEGEIADIDPITYRSYGEDGPSEVNNFSEEVSLDLMKAFNDLGASIKLSEDMLLIVNNQSLKYIRNQFFARKGYVFKTDAMKDYFSSKSWYTPELDDVNSLLSNTEKYNIELIKKLEAELK